MTRSLLTLPLLLAACGRAPLDPYFPEEAVAPSITGITPAEALTALGGQEVVIAGTGLDTVQTVVFGTRNAEIIEVGAEAISVRIPAQPAGAGAVEVALATDNGIARLEDGFAYQDGASEALEFFTAGEDISVSVTVEECPILAWAEDATGTATQVAWCGLTGARVDASAWKGSGLQPGFAGEMSPVGTLSELPAQGEVVVNADTDPRQLPPAEFFDFLPEGARIGLRAHRNWDDALDFVDERKLRLADTLLDPGSVSIGPTVVEGRSADASVCFTGVEAASGSGQTLYLDGAPDDWDTVRVGYTTSGALEQSGFVGSSVVQVLGDDTVVTGAAGVSLPYDFFTGQYAPDGDLGAADIPFGAAYALSTRELESQDVVRGTVTSVERLQLLEPDLMSGDVELDPDEDIVIRWEPGVPIDEEGPTFLSVVLRVIDGDTERWRLVGQGDDRAGEFTIPSTELGELADETPTTSDGQTIDRWAELIVARHQLRSVDVDDERTDVRETMVVDFVSAVSGPVWLVRE